MPDWLAYVRQRLSLSRLGPHRESAIVDEIAAQRDDAYRAAVAAGDTPAKAAAAVHSHVTDWEAQPDGMHRRPKMGSYSCVGP